MADIFDFAEAIRAALEFHFIRWWREYVIIVVVVVLVGALYVFTSPAHFPAGQIVSVSHGASVREVARDLKAANVIRSSTAFIALARISGTSRTLHAGPYRFERAISLPYVLFSLAAGEHGISPARITIPEGDTTIEEAALVAKALPGIGTTEFLEAARGKQGYLFPDTYIFNVDATADFVVDTLRHTFDVRLATIMPELATSTRSISDLVKMASLLEGEAKSVEDKKIVAGILWKRLSIGMALQVDAAPETYEHQGLPLEPINNPGLEAILAATHPTDTKYLYYLTGDDGLMHYARTFDEHKANLLKYLK